MKSFLAALSEWNEIMTSLVLIFFEFSRIVCSSDIWSECSPPQVEFKHLPSGEKRFPACFLSVHRFTRNKLIEMRKEDKEASENKLAYQYPFPSPPPSRGESSIHRSLSIIHQIYSRNFTKKQSLDKCEYITIPFLVLERIFQFFEKKTRSSI